MSNTLDKINYPELLQAIKGEARKFEVEVEFDIQKIMDPTPWKQLTSMGFIFKPPLLGRASMTAAEAVSVSGLPYVKKMSKWESEHKPLVYPCWYCQKPIGNLGYVTLDIWHKDRGEVLVHHAHTTCRGIILKSAATRCLYCSQLLLGHRIVLVRIGAGDFERLEPVCKECADRNGDNYGK